MNFRRRQTASVALIICAAYAAQISSLTHAAVPIEESVGDSREGQSVTQPVQQSAPRASARRQLDIPPTIEPTVNTDYSESQSAGVQSSDAARPVSQPLTRPPNQTVNSGDSGQLRELFYQLQVLQQEIQNLRGQVEEQNYLVSRLQRDQKEQYLDLDRRMIAMSTNQPTPGPTSRAPTEAAVAGPSGNLTEREAYNLAFEKMKSRQFAESMSGFQSLIETYPNGQYTPNAYYWIGELHLKTNAEYELARQSFMQVISLYPDSQKVPDSLYKLGVVYHNLEDLTNALKFLGQVQAEHPTSPAADLAAKYAAELQ